MKWLVTVNVVIIGRSTGSLYYDSYTKLVDGPNEFAGAVDELVASAVNEDHSVTITGCTINPTNQKD